MNIVIYVIATLFGLALSFMGIVFAALSGPEFAQVLTGVLFVAHVASFIFVYKKAKQGQGPQAAVALVLPLPIVWAVMYLYIVAKTAITSLEPHPEQFTNACRNAGATYYKAPTKPVHSIGFDWDSKYAPVYNHFSLGGQGKVNKLGYAQIKYPETITFTEEKPSRRIGYVSEGTGRYIRISRDMRTIFRVEALTTDVVVKYYITPEDELAKAASDQGMVSYQITVTDRRDGERLADLWYVLDAKNRLACGLTEERTMNVQTFILKAIETR